MEDAQETSLPRAELLDENKPIIKKQAAPARHARDYAQAADRSSNNESRAAGQYISTIINPDTDPKRAAKAVNAVSTRNPAELIRVELKRQERIKEVTAMQIEAEKKRALAKKMRLKAMPTSKKARQPKEKPATQIKTPVIQPKPRLQPSFLSRLSRRLKDMFTPYPERTTT